MREVIQGLIEAEREARRTVQSAREEAERLVADARKRAQDLAVRARQDARAEAANSIETAVEAARQERKKRLEESTAEIQTQARMDEVTRDRLVEAVVRCVCGQP